MGPQLYRCGNEKKARYAVYTKERLQWGRNFIVAEIIHILIHLIASLYRLQWGRNFIVAEMPYLARYTSGNKSLQWGRNFIVAEMPYLARYTSGNKSLQWGRNFIVAEISTDSSVPHAEYQASMGPQLYRCGNMPQEHGGRGRIAPLQWGRNFIVAEIRLTADQTACTPSFNGAATLSLRKYVAWPYAHGAFVELQWGRNFIVAEIRPIHCLL